MEPKTDPYIVETAEQCALAYSKFALCNEQEFAHLVKTLTREMTLAFGHLLISEE